MTIMHVEYQGKLRTRALHVDSGAQLLTDAPKDNNGDGVPVMRQDNPTLAIEYPLEEAYVTVYLRSLGLGWTAWRLHPDVQRGLATFFNSRLPQAAPTPAKPIPFR